MNSDLKAGMLFEKNCEIYLLADSSNMRWLVNVMSGTARWLAKANDGFMLDMIDKKGYKYIGTTKELLSNGPIAKQIKESDPIEEEYKPLVSFEEALKQLFNKEK